MHIRVARSNLATCSGAEAVNLRAQALLIAQFGYPTPDQRAEHAAKKAATTAVRTVKAEPWPDGAAGQANPGPSAPAADGGVSACRACSGGQTLPLQSPSSSRGACLQASTPFQSCAST